MRMSDDVFLLITYFRRLSQVLFVSRKSLVIVLSFLTTMAGLILLVLMMDQVSRFLAKNATVHQLHVILHFFLLPLAIPSVQLKHRTPFQRSQVGHGHRATALRGIQHLLVQVIPKRKLQLKWFSQSCLQLENQW